MCSVIIYQGLCDGRNLQIEAKKAFVRGLRLIIVFILYIELLHLYDNKPVLLLVLNQNVEMKLTVASFMSMDNFLKWQTGMTS